MFYLNFATLRTFRVLVYTSIGIVSAISVTLICIFALQCPKYPHLALSPAFFGNRHGVFCFDLKPVLYWQAAFNMVSDLIILALPLPFLIRLRMHTGKRVLLLAVFLVGLLIPVASGIRLWGVWIWAHSGALARYYGGYVIFW